MADRVLVEVTIAAPAAEVWEALRDPAKIQNWFGWDADTLKDEIDFVFFKHAEADEAARVLRFAGVPDRFEVVEEGGRTLLRVVRAVADGESWEGVYDDMAEGWISFVHQLRFGIERHGLARRRTLFLDGAVRPGGRAASAALGLADLTPGQPGEVVLATGEATRGELQRYSPWQVGLSAAAWGEGLLVVVDKPATDSAPHGRGMATLTTYGLSEAEFGELERRWRSWWGERF